MEIKHQIRRQEIFLSEKKYAQVVKLIKMESKWGRLI